MATSRSLGTLTLDLIAKIGGFTDALSQAARKTQDQLSAIEKRFSDFGGTVENILGAIGIGVGLEKVVSGIADTIKQMDQLNKSAQKVGLPVEQFSQLAVAAQLSNVNVDELVSTLGKLSKNEALATNPMSQQANIFRALGINVKDASGNLKSSNDIMLEFADSLQKLGVNTTTTAAGIALFGKNYQDLIPFFQQGSDGIKAANEEAVALGATLSGSAADAATKFEDNLTEIKVAGQGIYNQLAQALLPTLNEWTDDIVNLAKDHSTLQSIANTLNNTLHVLAAAAIEVGAGFKVVAAAVETATVAAANGIKNAAALYKAFANNKVSLNPFENFKNSLASAKAFYKEFNANNQAARDSVSQIWSSATDSLSKALDAAKKQIGEVGNTTAPIHVATQQIVDLSAAVDKIATGKVKGQSGITKATQEIAALGAAAIKAGQNVDDVQSIMAKGIAKLQQNAGNAAALKKLQDALNPKATQQAQKAADTYQALADAVAKVTGSVDPAQKALAAEEDTIRNLGKLADAAIRAGVPLKQVQELLEKGIAGAQAKYEMALAAPMKAAQDYKDALDQQLDVQKQQIDAQVQSMTIGSKAAQQAQELLKIQLDGAKAIAQFQKQYEDSVAKGNPNATQEQYNSELKSLKDYWDNYYKITQEGQDQVNSITSSYTAGLEKGMADYIEKMNDYYSQGQQFISTFADGLSNAFEQFASGTETAKKAFGDFIDTLYAQALKFVADKAIQQFFSWIQGMGNNNSGSDEALGGIADAYGSGSSSSSSFWGSIASVLGSLFGGGKASGGPVQAGTLYRVNERQPELLSVGGQDYLMMGSNSGMVSNVDTSRSAAGRRSLIINQYIQPTSTRRTADQIATATSRKLRQASIRNG